MDKPKVLVVEDEEDIQELIRYNLAKEGHDVVCVTSGEEAMQQAKRHRPDLICLDLMLPGLDGGAVCRMLKKDKETKDIPVIMVTARGEESDVVAGLELGAEDYITKPFSPKILMARVRSVLRRKLDLPEPEPEEIELHGLSINRGRHEVKYQGTRLEFTATEFGILHFLARKPGWVFSRAQIIDGVKGDDYPVTDRSVDVQVVSLRRKLGEAGALIETVRGVGYRFKE
jgi:two-component system phosphate regulon response regulator PhoB